MASAIRVFPALIALSVGVLAFKGADLAEAVAEVVDDAGPAAAENETSSLADGATSASAADEAAPPAAAETCTPSLNYASETGISEQEILVLRSLADRRKALDDREVGIATREQVAAAAEARLDEQIAELKTLESQINRQLAAMDQKSDERMTALVKTYEAMKPKEAAAIFNAMDDKVLLELSKSMKPATPATIMAGMDTRRAESLTRMLAALADSPRLSSPPAPASTG